MERLSKRLIDKRLCLLISSIFLLFTAGCTNADKSKVNPDFQKAVFKENSIVIEYPQIGNDAIDRMLKEAALSVLKYYDTDSGEDYSELLINIGYSAEIFDDKVLSVVFEGTGRLNAEFHRINRYRYSVNIDLKSGEKLRLGDFTDVNGDFITKFRAAAESRLGEEFQKFFDVQSDEQLLKTILTADTLDSGSDVGSQRDVFSYISNGEICIIYTAPHALGDYLTVKL